MPKQNNPVPNTWNESILLETEFPHSGNIHQQKEFAFIWNIFAFSKIIHVDLAHITVIKNVMLYHNFQNTKPIRTKA